MIREKQDWEGNLFGKKKEENGGEKKNYKRTIITSRTKTTFNGKGKG